MANNGQKWPKMATARQPGCQVDMVSAPPKGGPWLMKIYPTPPPILTLVTWVPQSKLAFGRSAHRLAIGPSALAKPNPTLCSTLLPS